MNDFRRSENPTKPTTSDMTPRQILQRLALASTKQGYLDHESGKPGIGFRTTLVSEALAAIEAIRKADMEAVIGEDGKLKDCRHGSFDWDSYCIRGSNELRAEQRQRMNQRLNNERKTDE